MTLLKLENCSRATNEFKGYEPRDIKHEVMRKANTFFTIHLEDIFLALNVNQNKI